MLIDVNSFCRIPAYDLEAVAVRDRLEILMGERLGNDAQAELARRLGETWNWVHYRLRGTTAIKADELPRIAAAIGVQTSDFFEEGSPTRSEVPPAFERAFPRDGAGREIVLEDPPGYGRMHRELSELEREATTHDEPDNSVEDVLDRVEHQRRLLDNAIKALQELSDSLGSQ